MRNPVLNVKERRAYMTPEESSFDYSAMIAIYLFFLEIEHDS